MRDNTNSLEPEEVANQLKLPTGKAGIEMAELMHQSNASMIQSALKCIGQWQPAKILEIGHASAAHVPRLLQSSIYWNYTGLEMSLDMYYLAIQNNQEFILNGQAGFEHYSGEQIPFLPNSFNYVFTVNTLYFWTNPVAYLNQIYTILKPNGRCVICFGLKEYLTQLPFTNFGFTLYSISDFEHLVNQTPFKIDSISKQQEWITSKTGELVLRQFATAVLTN